MQVFINYSPTINQYTKPYFNNPLVANPQFF